LNVEEVLIPPFCNIPSGVNRVLLLDRIFEKDGLEIRIGVAAIYKHNGEIFSTRILITSILHLMGHNEDELKQLTMSHDSYKEAIVGHQILSEVTLIKEQESEMIEDLIDMIMKKNTTEKFLIDPSSTQENQLINSVYPN
jgi:hypothetical protein